MNIRIGEVITAFVLIVSVLGTIFVCHEREMEDRSLVETIRAEVKTEMDRRYRNVPRIEINKVYTLHATGEDLVIVEEEEDGADMGLR